VKQRFGVSVGLVVATMLALAVTASSDARSQAQGVIPLLRIGQVIPHAGTLDETKQFGAIATTALGLETLTTATTTGKIKPWLAQSVTQPGKAVYVYHLRHVVKFWDGNELTADDVANSLNYERYPTSQVHSFGFPSVKNVQAIGRYTVVVTLRHPDPAWSSESSIYGYDNVFEKKFQQAHKSTFGLPGTLVMGTGPWKIDSFNPLTGAALSANPHWWGGKVPVQRITFTYFSDENSMALAFRAGDIDVAGVDGLGDPRSFAGTAATKVLTAPSLNEVFISMNTGVGPFSDIHVRRAVAYAVDRAGLISAAGGTGYARPVTTVILPIQLGTIATSAQVDALVKSLPQYSYDLAKAKQEMAKSAYPNGFSFPLLTGNYWSLPTVGQALAASLKQIGITLTISSPTLGAYFGELVGPSDKRPFSIIGAGALGPGPEGWDVLWESKNVKPGQENFANYTRPQVDALIQQEELTPSPAKRLPIFKKLLTIYANDVPYVALYSPDFATALASRFSWPTFNAYTVNGGTWPFELKTK
jgi:peptide/nickel transport system substrate-binding protein